MGSVKIREVWNENFRYELLAFDAALSMLPVVSLDTEFPGFLMQAQRNATDIETFRALKFNVDRMQLIQLGVTLSDEDGNVFATWEFNFRFDLKRDVYARKSIGFLEKHGLDFEKLNRDGIDVAEFANLFALVISKHRHNLEWVTFHGLYDLAYTLKLLTRKSLPTTLEDLADDFGAAFGSVVDVKYMAKFCGGLDCGELGLQKLAGLLGIQSQYGAHNAGADSLVTAQVFAEIKKAYPRIQMMPYKGILYGISSVICYEPLYEEDVSLNSDDVFQGFLNWINSVICDEPLHEEEEGVSLDLDDALHGFLNGICPVICNELLHEEGVSPDSDDASQESLYGISPVICNKPLREELKSYVSSYSQIKKVWIQIMPYRDSCMGLALLAILCLDIGMAYDFCKSGTQNFFIQAKF